LLATWYYLSDVVFAKALSDRASFRRFCGFSRDEETPERTAFVRFRRQLVTHGLDRRLFEAVARDFKAKGAAVRKGTLIDATAIGSAAKRDKDAAWVRHRTRAPAHGFKAHIAADKDTGIIREVETTPAKGPDVAIALRSFLKSPARFTPTKPRCAGDRGHRLKAEPGSCARYRWLPAERLRSA
jgi:IS5 family transposase